VRIAGNMALNHAVGFILSPKRGRIVASGNTAIGNHAGFLARGFNPADFVLLVNNVATGNVGMGFELTGTAPHVAVGNRSDANHDGFAVSGGPFQFRQNTVVGNTGVGFIVTNSGGPFEGGHLFRENSVIGNRDPGFVFTGRGNNTVRRNNIFGNGDCGIFNQSNFVVTATQNFWGLPSGPGVDPADAAGPPCDARGSTTVTTPFATSAFPIN
jgi:parallel beta-helix repeat protein